MSKFGQILAFNLTTTMCPGSFRECRDGPFVGKGRRGSHEQGEGHDLIKVFL